MSESPKKYGICSEDNCSCCSIESVCHLHPELGSTTEWSMSAHQNVVVLNKSCSHYFATVTALEASRKEPRYGGNSPRDMANKFTASYPQVLSKDSGLSSEALWASYVQSKDSKREMDNNPRLAERFSQGSDSLLSALHMEQSFDGLGGKYGNIEIVGRDEPSSERCGYFRHLKICNRTELHHNSLDGNFESKVYVRVIHTWCHNPRCRICYKHGFAVRGAKNASEIINEASKKHDSPAEHIIYSPSISNYALSFDKLRAMARKDLMANGIVGGALVFHGFRFHRARYSHGHIVEMADWYWSPHFHCVGFIRGGYSHCRNCSKVKNSTFSKPSESVCRGCSGFENKVRKYFEGHGCIIKVKDKRQSIVGTIWYELTHASLDVSKKRFHCLTYFGSCSYTKLKFERKKHEDLCPLCQHELIKGRYFGSVEINTDFHSPLFKRELFMEEFEDGKPVFAVLDDGFNGMG